MNQNSNDADRLLKIAGDGDDDALGALIENYRPMLRAEAMRSLAQVQARVDPSDIVQHTWWSAFRAFPKFEGDVDAFVGWLRKIHERNLRDAVRDQHAEKRAIQREVSASALLQAKPENATTPSQKLLQVEQRELMSRCIDTLPPAQREALRLRYYDGLSITEIVERIGRSDTAVAGLLKRALSTLRELMMRD